MVLLHPVEDWAVVQMAVASPNLQSKKGNLKKICVNLGDQIWVWLLSSEESDSVTRVVSTLVQCRSAPFM